MSFVVEGGKRQRERQIEKTEKGKGDTSAPTDIEIKGREI